MNRRERRGREKLGRKGAPGAAMRTAQGQALRQAMAHRVSGRLREAAAIYRSLLTASPDDPEALYGLASTHAAAGDIVEARDLLARVVEIEPGSADAFSDLGVMWRRLGDVDRARDAYQAALGIDPGHVDALYNFANVRKAAGETDEAAALYARALARDPGHLGALNNLGLLLHDRDDFEGAAALYARALERDATLPQAHNNLGNARRGSGALDEAVASYRRAVELDAFYGDAWRNLSVVLQDLDRLEDAADPARRAVEITPDDAELHLNLGTLMMKLGRMEAAGAAFDAALAIDPNYPEARWNRAQWLLLSGNFRDGWTEYEWRLRCPGLNAHGRDFDKPLWTGGSLQGQRILIHVEQGFGDTLQFIRFLPLVKQQGGQVLLECRPELARLLEGIAGCDALVPVGGAMPDFDCYAPLLSLAHRFAIDGASLPAAPYLSPPAPPLIELPESGKKRIGLVWAGRPGHANDHNRSVALDRFRPLLATEGCSFFSLQFGPGRDQIQTGGLADAVTDLGEELGDFAVTASAIAQLDLVIAVDTAVGHLAGALGKPVWLLLSHVPDWRWMLGRDDTPWYPTMRLFRQPALGDWDSVFAELETALADLGTT